MNMYELTAPPNWITPIFLWDPPYPCPASSSDFRPEWLSEWSVVRKTYRSEKDGGLYASTSQLQFLVFLCHLGTWDLEMGEKLSLGRGIRVLSVTVRGARGHCCQHSPIAKIKSPLLTRWLPTDDGPSGSPASWKTCSLKVRIKSAEREGDLRESTKNT